MTYKVFANGNPLQASEINLNLMQQAIAVFTDATAREAAIAVPVNGQFAYLTGTSNLTKYTGAAWEDAISVSPTITTEGDLIVGDSGGNGSRLPIVTAGTALQSDGTTAEWSAISVSENWEQLATGSLTSGSTLQLTGFASKNKYYIALKEVTFTSQGVSLNVKINNASANYSMIYSGFQARPTYSKSVVRHGITTDLIKLAVSGLTHDVVYGNVFISGGKSGGQKFIQFHGVSQPADYTEANHGMGVYDSTSAISTLEIITTGTFSSGTYVLYGTD